MHQTSAWLPEDLYEWLRQEAFKRRTSQNKLIIEALEALRAASRDV